MRRDLQSRLVFQTRRTEDPRQQGTAQHGIGGEWDLGDAGPPSPQTRGRGALGASQGRDLHTDIPVPCLLPAALVSVLSGSRRGVPTEHLPEPGSGPSSDLPVPPALPLSPVFPFPGGLCAAGEGGPDLT